MEVSLLKFKRKKVGYQIQRFNWVYQNLRNELRPSEFMAASEVIKIQGHM